jgi:hypothetical protein
MDESEIREIMAKTVSLALDRLDDIEVAALYQSVLFGNNNPHSVMGYKKVEHLFKNGMHEETKIAFLAAAEHRINQPDFGKGK